MTSRERLLTALQRGVPDRLPVTTHHLMPSFLQAAGLATDRELFNRYGLDAIAWLAPLVPDPSRGAFTDPAFNPAFESWSFVSDQWRVEREQVAHPRFATTRYRCLTPRGTLSMVLQDDGRTVWVAERLVKHRPDVDLIADFAPVPLCDAPPVRDAVSALGPRGIVRGAIPGFAFYGQPGCWQDAAVLVGIEELILATYDDPEWVLALLGILRDS
jgi:uroporphyrinogen decarboxylase